MFRLCYILNKGGKLTGILDFEWAFAGDPANALMITETRQAMLPGTEAAFVDGYLSIRPLDEQLGRRTKIYQLFLALETMVMHNKDGNTLGVQHAQKNLIDLLDQVERWVGT